MARSCGSDVFGDSSDDDALILAATQAEASQAAPCDFDDCPRPPKRLRLARQPNVGSNRSRTKTSESAAPAESASAERADGLAPSTTPLAAGHPSDTRANDASSNADRHSGPFNGGFPVQLLTGNADQRRRSFCSGAPSPEKGSANKQSCTPFHPVAQRQLERVIATQPQRSPAATRPWLTRSPVRSKPNKVQRAPLISGTSWGPSEEMIPVQLSEDDERASDPLDAELDEQTMASRLNAARQHPPIANAETAVELADIPSDAFSSSTSSPNDDLIFVDSQPVVNRQKLVAPPSGLVQTTLFGKNGGSAAASQTSSRRNWPLANVNEPPTHHELDHEACKTWVYPTNLGKIRDYQFNIVARGLYHNLLVALPTGLGKTFIAATIMLNWYRWTKNTQLVFLAPTRPLVAQQVEACLTIAGIPRHQTTMLTGEVSAALRAGEWEKKRVFFMTPQTFMNDLKRGTADPKRIVLVVADEAHRATGAYSYVEVVKFISRFNESFRILALTATPGSDVESVQKVIDGLHISRVEIRTEQSFDIREYIHRRQVEKMVFKNSEEMEMLMALYAKAVQPVLNVVVGMNAYWQKDPVALTPYGCTQAMRSWMGSDAGRHATQLVRSKVGAVFTILASLAHSMELLKYHGIIPFYHALQNFRRETETTSKSKYRKEINDSESFERMMRTLGRWTADPDFIGHPKLQRLQEVILNHLMDCGEGNDATTASSGTRIMVFAHFRDSAEEIRKVLQRNRPMIRPHVFVGQASGKNSEGMTQKRQSEVIGMFKSGALNTLIATSIGEEGLDIGEVDLIICYDSKASPLRMLQRMGRTGRKRAGKIVLFQMEGKEESDALKAKDSYESMQAKIADGGEFTFHNERSRRILPRDIQPVPDRRKVVIPPENSQRQDSDFYPVPTKRGRGRPLKIPKKRFNMPDGVRTGFTTALQMGDEAPALPSPRQRTSTQWQPTDETVQVPDLGDVRLSVEQTKQLRSLYQEINFGDEEMYNAEPHKNLGKFPESHKRLAPTKLVGHGQYCKRFIDILRRMGQADKYTTSGYDPSLLREFFGPDDNSGVLVEDGPGRTVDAEIEEMQQPAAHGSRRQNSRAQAVAPRSRRLQKIIKSPSSAAEGAASSPPSTAPDMALPSQGIALGSADTSGEDEVHEEWDSDLATFIAGDDEPIHTVSSSIPLPSLDGTPLVAKATNVLFTSSQKSATSEDLPEMETLLRSKSRMLLEKRRMTVDEDVWGNPSRGKLAVPLKKRRVVVSEDED